MPRGKNPDGTPKRYPTDSRPRKKKNAAPKVAPYRQPAWHERPEILTRLEIVERARLAGNTALQVSRMLGLPYDTVREDFFRLNELWLSRLSRTQEQLRAEAMRKLDLVVASSLETLRMDELYAQAVLFNQPVTLTCPGRQEHRPSELRDRDRIGPHDRETHWGEVFSCTGPHPITKRVYHDEKGSAQYRRVAGQVLQALNTAIMNQARLNGLVIEKKALTDAEGNDLPSALRAILLGEESPGPPVEIREDGMPMRSLDIGLA